MQNDSKLMVGFSAARARPERRHLAGGVITAIGLLLLAVPMYDIWDDVSDFDWALVTTLAENATFLLLALGLAVGGVWLVRSDWRTRHVTLVAKWTVTGWAAATVLFAWVIYVQLWAMSRLKPYVIAMDGVLIGTTVTFALGLYSARTDIQRAQLQSERETTETLEALHTVASTLQDAETSTGAYDAVLDAIETLLAPDTARIVRDGEIAAERTSDSAPPIDAENTLTAPIGDRGRLEVGAPGQVAYAKQSLEILSTHLDRALHRVEREQALAEERRKLALVNRTLRHDVLNDLQTIRLRLPAIEEEAEPPEEHWAVVTRSVEKMSAFIQQMREYMQLIEGDDPSLEPVPLRPIVEEQVLQVEHANPDAELVVGDVPDVKVEANDLLGAVIENLVRNGIDHNDKDTPRVWVDGTRKAGVVTVEVADNGPGIPDAEKDAIKERGAQRGNGAGSGFGLYLVTEALDTYGGRLEILDNEPEGAIFRITLPLA